MTHRIIIANSNDDPIEFWLEPSGDGVVLQPRTAATVRFCGPEGVDVLIQASAGKVVFWVEGGDLCTQVGRQFEVDTVSSMS